MNNLTLALTPAHESLPTEFLPIIFILKNGRVKQGSYCAEIFHSGGEYYRVNEVVSWGVFPWTVELNEV